VKCNQITLGLAVSMRQAPLLVAVAGLAVLGFVQWWLAHRTHRMISPWMLVATTFALTGCVAVSIGVIGGNIVAREVADGPYAATVASSAALAEATDAKSQASLALIKRGSGQEHEERFHASTTRAAELLSVSDDAAGTARPTGDLLRTWLDGHARIRALDDAGRWRDAVAAASRPATRATQPVVRDTADALVSRVAERSPVVVTSWPARAASTARCGATTTTRHTCAACGTSPR
jgi:hypothetical protein